MKIFFTLLLVFSTIFVDTLYAQCLGGSSFVTASAPTGSNAVTITTCNWAGDYNTITNCISGSQYTFTASPTAYITITQGAVGGTVLGYGFSPVTVTCSAAGPLYMHVNSNAACGSDVTCHTTTVSLVSCSTVNQPANQTVCNGTNTTTINFTGNGPATTYNWTNSDSSIGLAANGVGDIAGFAATNNTAVPVTATITVVPSSNACTGAAKTFTITVNPSPVAIASPSIQTLCNGATTGITLSSNITGTTFSWTPIQNGVTGATAGNGSSIAQTLSNSGNTIGSAIYTIIPTVNSCPGQAIKDTVWVNPSFPGNTIYVDSANGNDANAGSSWAAAFKTLSYALKTAQSACNNSIDSILVAKGTYYPTGAQSDTNRDSTLLIGRGGLKIYGGYPNGGGTRNIAANPSVLSGDIGNTSDSTDNSYHVMVIAGIAATADSIVLDGLTIVDGLANKSTGTVYNGQNISGKFGAGITVKSCLNAQKTTIRNTGFRQNAVADAAGGMYISTNSDISVVSCTFDNNRAFNGGTGMQINQGSNPLIMNCIFTSNAGTGGTLECSSTSTPFVTNCTFSNNSGNGAISIWANATPAISNVIIYNHTGSRIFGTPGTGTTISNSLIQGGYTGTGAGANIINADPLFINAPGNLQLQPCSPAINTGNNAALPAGITSDIAGNPRIYNATVDMGVYEYQGIFTMPVDTISQIICANDSTLFNGTYYHTAGYYSDTLQTAIGCDSVVTLNLAVKPVPVATLLSTNQTLCTGDTASISPSSNLIGTTYSWSVMQTGVTGAAAGSGDSIVQPLVNTSIIQGSVIYVITPSVNGCTGIAVHDTVVVNPVPVAALSGTSQALCSGTATNIVPGSNVSGTTYTWTVTQNGATGAAAGSGTSIAQALATTGASAGTVIYTITPLAAGCPGGIINDTVTVNPVLVPSVTAAANTGNTICAGTNVTFTATPVNGGTTPAYQWRKNGLNVGTNSTTYSDNSLNNNDVITVQLTSDAICRSTDTVNSAGITMTVNNILVPSVTAAANTGNTVCAGTNVTFTATPVNGGTTPAYQWRKNGLNVGTNSTTYSDNTLNNNDVITVRLTSDATCRSADTVSSTGITMTVNNILVPSVTAAANPGGTICAGTNVTFTATPVNGGTTPTYQWRKNGLNVGTNSITYPDNTLNNNDVITVRLTSDATCRSTDTVNSTGITMSVNPYPVMTATPATQTLCSGGTTGITLSAPQAGATYSWTVAQSGTSGAAAGNGNSIAQALTATAATAGTATYTITPSVGNCVGTTATATIIVNPVPVAMTSPAFQTVCSGAATNIQLSAGVTGTTYSWTVSQTGATGATAGNGAAITQILTATGTGNGSVTYTVTPTANGCPGSPITVTITVVPTPALTVSPTTQTLCSGASTGITLSAPQTGTTFSWSVTQSGVSGAAPGNGSGILQSLTATGTAAGTATYTITPAIGSCQGTAGTATITVNPQPVVTATPASQTLCSGTATGIALSSNISSSTYAWTIAQSGVTGATAGNGTSIAQTLTNSGTTAGTATYTVTPTAAGCAGTALPVVITVNPKPSATATPASQSLCSGSTTSIALSSSVTGTTFAWTATQSGVTGAAAGNGTTIAQALTAAAPVTGTATYTVTPTANSCAGNTTAITVTVNAIPATPGAITGANAPCAGSTQTYSISSVTGATGYTWTLPAGWTGTSVTNSITVTVGNGTGTISVQAGNTCGSSPASTRSVTATPVLTPAISISSNAPALICSGTSVTYTATIGNGGTTPTYQWKRNGSNVGANAGTYTYVPQNGDTITCTLTSNYPCLNANGIISNAVIMTVTPTVDPVLNIYVPENHICSDIPVTFVATPTNGGTVPAYQWKRNNSNVGTNSASYTYTPSNGDIVSCVLTSNAICASSASVTSNEIPMSIIPVTHPSLSITANPGTQLTTGQPVTFSAQVGGAGGSGFQVLWYRGTAFTGTGNNWTAIAGTDVFNGSVIKAYLQSFSPCALPDSAWSNPIRITIGTTGIGDPGMPEGFKAYPNPTHGIVYFEGLHKGDQLIVYDASGRVLLHKEATDDKVLSTDISRFAQGAYLFYFTGSEGKRWQVKVFKD